MKLYQPMLPFSPRIRSNREKGSLQQLLTSRYIAKSKSKFSRIHHIGYKSGSSIYLLCPYHKEKSPSFCVSTIRHKSICYGCGICMSNVRLGNLIFGKNENWNLTFGKSNGRLILTRCFYVASSEACSIQDTTPNNILPF